MHFFMASPSSLNWSLVQAFLAVAERGSLSAAARSLGVTQPTLGRQVRAIEDQLGAELFRRTERGFDLTETGHELLAPARAMREAAHQMQLQAVGQQSALCGSVRVSASVVVANYHLPSIMARLRQKEPHISLELAPMDTSSNLHFREADIAIRMYRPTQLDLVTLCLGELEIGVYAAHSYIERRGLPQGVEDFEHHDVVGFDQDSSIVDGFRAGGFEVNREWFPVRCDHPTAYWELVRAGCGIGFSQVSVAERDELVQRLPIALPIPRLPVWLTAHEAVRHTPRVARIWELLVEELRPLVKNPERSC